MANEAQIRASLNIRKLSDDGTLVLIDYRRSIAVAVDVTGTKGPTPGSFTVATTGTDVDLSNLDHPGLCFFQNQDQSNPVKVGRYDPDTGRFYPLMRLLPGEGYVLRLDPDVGDEYIGTGTGTSATVSTLRAIAENAPVNLLVEAFEV